VGRGRTSRGFRDGPPGNSQANKIPKLVFVVQPNATVASGSPLTQLPAVQLQDQDGNNIAAAGVLVTFGMGASDLTTVSVRTDTTGRATLTALVVDESPGVYAVTARADNLSPAFSSPVTVTSSNTPPVAAISTPTQGFSVANGAPVSLNPTGTVDAESGWVGTWSVLGPGGVVRFSHTGVFGNFGSHVTTWTPSVAETVTVRFTATDAGGLSNTAQLTGTVTAVAPAPVSELTPMLALYPHLNSAFAEVTYGAKPPSGRVVLATDADAASFGVLQGRWSMLNGSGIADSDPTNPVFGPSVYDRPWFEGNDTGNGPGQMTIRPANTIPTNGYGEFYQCWIFKLPDTYGDGLIEQATSGAVTKMFGFWSKVDQNNPFYNFMQGRDPKVLVGTTTNRRVSATRCDFATQTGGADGDADQTALNYPGGSSSNQLVTVGSWFRLELYVKVNTVPGPISAPTGPGLFDGEVRWWLTNLSTSPNGTPVQVARHTNFKVRTQQKPKGFQQWLYDPTYGGNPGDLLTRTTHVFHAYCFQAWGSPL
jgi:hypothetical protein